MDGAALEEATAADAPMPLVTEAVPDDASRPPPARGSTGCSSGDGDPVTFLRRPRRGVGGPDTSLVVAQQRHEVFGSALRQGVQRVVDRFAYAQAAVV